MPETITARQREVLAYLHAHQRQHGSMPTMVEVAHALDLKSANGAYEHALALQKKGLVTLARGVARGIQLTAAGRQLLGIGSPSPIGGDRLMALPVVDMARVNGSRA